MNIQLKAGRIAWKINRDIFALEAKTGLRSRREDQRLGQLYSRHSKVMEAALPHQHH